VALHDRLTASADLPVTIVVGAVGSGKTSVLIDWCHDQPPDAVTWLSADLGDADVERFWRAVIAAVERLDPTFGVDARDIITLDGEVSADVLESLLVDESLIDRRIALVIDDAHLVAPDALEQLGRLIARRPANLRLILGSRTDPNIGLPRLRLEGLVAEIRDLDLRFSVDEVRAMLDRVGLGGADVDVDDLHRRTEGWAAGVQLAALSVVGAPDPGARLRDLTGTHAIIADYLLDEVLANQSPHIHRFLEDTCVLDELDVVMCEALTDESTPGIPSPGAVLREVEEANLFLSRLDPAGTVYRYHAFFADLLRDQLRARDPERFKRQHRRAAEAYLGAGDYVRSVTHMWHAGDRQEAAQLIARNPLSVYLTTAPPPAFDPIGTIADESILADASLVGGYALALLMNARSREASDLIDRVDRQVGLEKLQATERINLLSLQAGARLLMGDSATAVSNLRVITEAIRTGETRSEEWIAVSIPVGARAAAWEGDLDLAEEVMGLFRSGTDPQIERVDLVAARAFVDFVRGDLSAAISAATDALAAASEMGVVGSGAELAARAVLGAALVDRGDLDAADEHLVAVLDSSRIERVPSIVLAAHARSRRLRARGNFDAALGALAAARSRFGDSQGALGNYLDLAEFMVVGAMRDVGRAEEISKRIVDPLLAGRMKAWCHLMKGQFDEAAAITRTLVELAHTPRQRFELAVTDARVAFERSTDDMPDAMSSVIDLAEETGLLLHIAEGGTAVLQEVKKRARWRVKSDVVDRLALMQPLPRPAHRVQQQHPHDELSAREQIVLRYMATSMSNQEIASALYLSVNTVKTHIKNVLRKMHAASRAQAVERARELNYL
jgi:LuxR family transcriptional regulator, maltose regulon positive regulatory protein